MVVEMYSAFDNVAKQEHKENTNNNVSEIFLNCLMINVFKDVEQVIVADLENVSPVFEAGRVFER